MVKEILAKADWSFIRSVIPGVILASGFSRTENEIIGSLFMRSIRYNRFAVDGDVQSMADGEVLHFAFPVNRTKSEIYRIRRKLIAENVLQEKVGKIMLNVPGLLRKIPSMFKGGEEMVFSQNADLIEKVDLFWRSQGWEIIDFSGGTPMDIEEAIRKGELKSLSARDRKKRKIESAELKATTLRDFMQSVCEENEVPFQKMFTQKDWGCASNFITYCKSAGVEPKEILRRVVESWPTFRTALKTDAGKPLVLPSVVSFSTFFKHREKILAWIDEKKEVDERFDFAVTEEKW